MKVSTCNILMTFLKNAKDQTQHPQNMAAMAISIAATTFMPHPLLSCAGKELTNWQEKELSNSLYWLI